MNHMNCEIEFLAVGEGSRPGDAIVIRYGSVDAYDLMIVDGGDAAAGERLVSHVQRRFANHAVSHVLLTHPDGDHASGLRAVVENLDVRHVWLHAPWAVAKSGRGLFKDPRWTEDGLFAQIVGNYDILKEIVLSASARNIAIDAPFQGDAIGPFRVLSPSVEAYLNLVPQFDKTPDPDQDSIQAAGYWIGKQSTTSRLIASLLEKAASWVPDSWGVENLRDGGITSASNESSVILYGQFDNPGSVLLTGDAGVRALTWAADYAEAQGLPLRNFGFVQVPHHGSRRNVGPTVLNRLIGPPVAEGEKRELRAYVSAPQDDARHPRKIVLNAFTRRGARVFVTQGNSIVNYGGFPVRADYGPVEAVPFSYTVESYS